MPKRPVGNPNAGFGGSAAPSTVGDFDADDFSMAETGAFAGSEANYIQRQPGLPLHAGGRPARRPGMMLCTAHRSRFLLLLLSSVPGIPCSTKLPACTPCASAHLLRPWFTCDAHASMCKSNSWRGLHGWRGGVW